MPVPPGPKKQFMLGHLSEYGKDPLAFLTKCAREYGDIVQLRFPQTRVYLLNHPDYIEADLGARNGLYIRHKGMRLRASQRLLGNGLLTSEGAFSRSQRRLALPAFHQAQIEAYGRVMTTLTQRMLAGWRPGEIRDLHQEMMQLTLEIVGRTLFDVDVSKATGDLATAALGILKDEFTAQRNCRRSLGAIFALPISRRAQKALQQLDRIIDDIIVTRSRNLERHIDLLSLLLAAHAEGEQRLTKQQLRDEVKTFFFAGHEATGLALSWAWYLLAQHPECEDRMATEVQSVLADRLPTVADLPRLRYAASVVKETLRLYPPAWAIGREARRNCVIGDYHVEAGTQLIMSQWITHRDPRFFDEPEKFRPQRWDNDLSKRLPRFAYFPYGGGERVCIGKAFAEMEMILLLVTIAQKFRFQLISPQHITLLPTFALVPTDGIKAELMERSSKVNVAGTASVDFVSS